eukprot:CAMPEP_0179064666 /NCGR_PEP_ID=MMETSP0796-20121207/28063_1 /TAXON_ID=73915 /ORGANISM="Pyrodinium bahamense, Strain pbaha01" /LENGTH=761 /DNA_ID=CAMNT_0020761615 /DNA_START=31 /DNA_END=2317 /DNA_ORIENTATION=+
MEPTRGAISRIFGGSSPVQIQPNLEVRNIRRLTQDTETRYAVSVTDGEFVVKALAIPGSSLIQQIEAGAVVVNTLIRANDYRLEELNGSAFLLIMKAEIVGMVPEPQRVPSERLQKFSNTRTGMNADLGLGAQADASAPAGVQAAQMPPWGGQPAFTTPERRAPTSYSDQTPMPQPMGLHAPGGNGPNPYSGLSAIGSGFPPQGANGELSAGAAAPMNHAGAGSGAANGGRGGTINDFFGRQPVASKTQSGGFMPIAELSPYTNGRWRVKARIIMKGDIRKFSNSRGEGQLFKITLADKSGEIAATFFGKAVDIFYPQLRQGQVYSFSRGHIKAGNPRFDRGEHVLTFEEQASIEALEDDREMPGVTFDFKPICVVQEMEVNTLVDVQAVICAVQEPYTFTAKASNREMVKRELSLWDNSGPEGASFINLVLWGDRALGDNFELGAPIFVKEARVTEWNNQKDLASPGVYEINPDDTRAFALKAKYEEQQRTRPLPITMKSSTPSASGSRKSIRGCREEDLQLGPPPSLGQGFDPNGPRSVHRHYLLATVTSLPPDRLPCYPACPGLVDSNRIGATQAQGPEKRACNKKVTQESPGIWRCAAGHVCQQPVFRYLCKMQVMDHTDAVEVNVYDNVARQFFGVEAGEYARIYDNPEQDNTLQDLNRRVLWRRVLLKLRSQKEVWQETERVRYNVDEASGVVLVKEARNMLSEIKNALAAEQPAWDEESLLTVGLCRAGHPRRLQWAAQLSAKLGTVQGVRACV